MQTIGLLKEPNFETRVCLLPKEVERMVKEWKTNVVFEAGYGSKQLVSDETYQNAGAEIAQKESILKESDFILSINAVYKGQELKTNATFIGIFNLLFHRDRLEKYLNTPASVYSLDLLPRTTLAQNMDVLSSMASLSGYKAVLKAAELFHGILPMFTTAAGTLKPAKVLVLGAGVAGLQAIATAKRLGAMVEAFDVRTSAKEEVKSLGAKFIEVPGYIESESAGGYAVEQSQEYLQKQKALMKTHIEAASIVISTANIPGKKAPVLIEKESVENMVPGAVIVDLAAEQGGNCELSQNGKTCEHFGVKIVGNSHLARELSQAASQLLSTNYFNFMKHLINSSKANDPLLEACTVLKNGKLVHPLFIES